MSTIVSPAHKGVSALTFTLVLLPIANVDISIVVEHRTFSFADVTIPQSLITIVVNEVVSATAMLLIFVPLSFILFAIGIEISAIALTLPVFIHSLIAISIHKGGMSLSIRFFAYHLTGIDSLCFRESVSAYF